MQNLKALDEDVQSRLEGIGGEPLAGSGFDDEQPETGFAAANTGEEE